MSTNASANTDDERDLQKVEEPGIPEAEENGETAANEKPHRKSERTRTLTDRMRASKEDAARKVFWKTHNELSIITNQYEVEIREVCSDRDLKHMKIDLEDGFRKIEVLYEDFRKLCTTPDLDVRRAVDQIKADTDLLVTTIQSLLRTTSPKSIRSRLSSRTSSSHMSRSSGRTSLTNRLVDAAANVAAHRAELEAKKTESRKEEELALLELEETKRRAEAEATMKKKRDELDQHRIEKRLSMEDARLQVYTEELAEDVQSRLFVRNSLPPAQGAFKTPLETPITISGQQPVSSDIAKLADALATSVSLNRLPAPEPSVFDGDPLKYNDWSLAFKALIEEKKICESDKIHYLKRYVSGPVREAVSGYLLHKSDTAFNSAKAILEERYGNPFVISEAFRDKLERWPSIQGRDGASLRKFADFLKQCEVAMTDMKTLDILNDSRENRKLLRKVPDWIVNRWTRIVYNSKKKNGIYPDFHAFSDFLTQEADMACDPIASLGSLKETPPSESDKATMSTTTPRKRARGANTLFSGTNPHAGKQPLPDACLLCSRKGHQLDECRTFARKLYVEKQDYIKKNGLCFSCLTSGHMAKHCKLRSVCKTCEKKHPTSLHREPVPASDVTAVDPANMKDEASSEDIRGKRPDLARQVVCRKVSKLEKDSVISSMIVPVWVSSEADQSKECLVYALLDTQSDTTFISSCTAEKLDAPSESVTLKLTTMTSKDKRIRCQKLRSLIVRGYDSNVQVSIPLAYTRDFIPVDISHIPTPGSARAWPHLRGIAHRIQPLQDCEVGLLIGYNCPQALAPKNYITGEGNQPFAVETDLGWSIVGRTDDREDSGDEIGLINRIIVREVPNDLQLRNDINSVPYESKFVPTVVHYICKTAVKEEKVNLLDINRILESDFKEADTQTEQTLSQEDIRFMDTISRGIHRQADGYYEMPLPFKEKPHLPNNRMMALSRFNHLKRRFRSDQQYLKDYAAFMQDTIRHGDAERIPPAELDKKDAWYIPHHGVYHPKKPKKIRVVFDCAAKYKGQALNDHLLKGPDLTNGLVGVLCRFRQEPVAFTCDIERMFHQFRVNKEDRDYLRFLWLDDDLDGVVDYRMNVHLFGAASSPGCANYALKRIAMDHKEESAEAAHFIQTGFYVDDGLKSVDSAENAIRLIKETREICKMGNLRLHKFVTNNREVLESIPSSERAQGIESLDLPTETTPLERVLGIQWCVESDQLQFRIVMKDLPLTRRGILSTVASVYDPLGFLAPFVLQGKQILQQMCRDGADWDEPLNEELRPRWDRWRLELRELERVKINRCYKPKGFDHIVSQEIHHFSDASMQGYGQCSYLRLVDINGKINCSLLMGKARVTPLKVVTIPRLELQAAVVSTKVSCMLKQELDYKDIAEHFWTDSKVVLGYIYNETKRFHIFVANRVQRIRESSQAEQWHHVSTEDNPADHASRGLYVNELLASNWFTGPSFLWQQKVPKVDVVHHALLPDDPEVKTVQVCATRTTERRSILQRYEHFSDWTAAVRGTAVLQRFILRRRNKTEQSLEEGRKNAERTIIKMLQQEFFGEEMRRLQVASNETNIGRKSLLHKLDPMLDEDDVLRVGGRLARSLTSHYIVQHPVILPKKSHITDLIIKHCHHKVAHQGRGMTVNNLRTSGYWVIGCTSVVSTHIYRCVECRKLRGRTLNQKMADLPKERLEPSPPFTYCGFDCFGPFQIKERRKELKKYGLLFTCMASRAVHIEMLDDMTTDAFINALRCFIALRGKVRQLRSDQGSNFMGAQHELSKNQHEVDLNRLQTFLAENNCDFVQNVPSASHMGGVWERQIRTIRNVLTAILKQSSSRLDTSSLRTFLYEAMAIVNSRPLTVENLGDPRDQEPLTPNHLLTMKSEVALPPPGNFVQEDVYARKRWRRVQFLADEFWSRWKKEYLANLQTRSKWNTKRRNLQVGDIVFLKEEDLVRGRWKLARVVQVMPSTDNLVRKVKLILGDSTLTPQGVRVKKETYLERPIHKLTLLLENPDEP